MKTIRVLAPAALLLFASHGQALACAACYGDTTGDKMGVAASWGIFAMVIIMFLMLGAVAGFGYYLNYRAKHPLPDYEALLSEDGGHEGLPKPETT
ncbi:MAG: hypothetical protein LV480_09155 [Methylacidiphilales bacterium]|nr:hypothetical protein [Candidatus Methylacidiphilales bacterium]